MRYLAPLSLLAMALALLLAVAGIIPIATVGKMLVALVAITVAYVAAVTVKIIRVDLRRQKALSEKVLAGPAPKYLLATAASPIREGDLVRVDLLNSTVSRIDRLPSTVEGPIQ